jgi:hypothetical protein
VVGRPCRGTAGTHQSRLFRAQGDVSQIVASRYDDVLNDWAAAHQLRRSKRNPCLHSLLGQRRPHGCYQCPDHSTFDHATVWIRDSKPAVLFAHSYRELNALRRTLAAHADGLDMPWWVGDPADPVSFYNPGQTAPLLVGAPGVDLQPLIEPHPNWASAATMAFLAHKLADAVHTWANGQTETALREAQDRMPVLVGGMPYADGATRGGAAR